MVLIRRHPFFPNHDDTDRRLSNMYDVQRTRCIPSVNVIENNDSFRLDVAAPGLSKEQFKIDIENDNLTLSSDYQHLEEKDQTILRKEFCYTKFERSFILPVSVDREKISAAYENGILKIMLPKKEEAKVKPPREIKIG